MALLQMQRINPQSYLACQVSNATHDDVVALSKALREHKWGVFINLVIDQVRIVAPTGVEQYADAGDWILVTDATATYTDDGLNLTVNPDSDVKVYSTRYPAQSGDPAVFVGLFTTNVPLEWTATDPTTHPVAIAQPEGSAVITFKQPTSANGPFTYGVTQTNIHDNTSAPAELRGDPVVDAQGVVTLVATGLRAGDGYILVVDLDTDYPGVSATAAPCNQITASA